LYNMCTRHIKLFAGILLLSVNLNACKPDVRENGAALKFFDLKKLIHADSARLTQAKVRVFKTVTHNNSGSQTKQVSIADWGRELNLFAASDINKPAWRQSYTTQKAGDSTTYLATDEKLTMQRMVVYKKQGKVLQIHITNTTKNLLSQSAEQLIYYPDSLYIINKQQQVMLLGRNSYLIKGIIKH